MHTVRCTGAKRWWRFISSAILAAINARAFGVRRRQAIYLLGRFGGYQVGRTFVVPREAPEDAIRARALAEPRVAEHVQGKQMVRFVVVPGRLVSVVVK